MKHIHYDVIIAFAEGKQVQVKIENCWCDANIPNFAKNREYRIKPEKPDFGKIAYRVWCDEPIGNAFEAAANAVIVAYEEWKEK